jgi:hypothetical protein
MQRNLILAALLAVSGCAQSLESRVADGLQEAGLPPAMSECMAERWVDRLSVAQLRRIQSFTDELKQERGGGRLTLLTLVEGIARLGDPEIVEVVSASTVSCALR